MKSFILFAALFAAVPALAQPNGTAARAPVFSSQLPAATTGAIGGVQVGSNITVNTGVISLTSGNVAGALGYTPLRPSNNLSDVASASTARVSLGLGDIATQNAASMPSLTTTGSMTAAAVAATALQVGAGGGDIAACLWNSTVLTCTPTGPDAGLGYNFLTKGSGAFSVNGNPAVLSISTGADIATPGLAMQMGNDIVPMTHAQNLRVTSAPVVVFAGTSVGLYAGNGSLAPQGTTQGLIRRGLMAANPGKTFTFYDRAIGGTTTAQLAGASAVPSQSRPAWWSGGTGLEWLANLQSLNPTQLYLFLGENDGANFPENYFKSILTTIAGWANPPDLFVSTPRVPGATFGTTHPNDYLMASGYLRTMSKSALAGQAVPGLSLGLVDVGRIEAVNVLGLDYGSQFLTNILAGPTLPITFTLNAGLCSTCYVYTAPSATAGDVYWQFVAPGQGATLFSNSNIVVIQLGAKSTNQLQLQVITGVLYATYYPGGSAGTIAGSTAYNSGADPLFLVAIQNGHLYVWYNNTVVLDRLVPQFVGPYTPNILFNSPPTPTPTMTLNYLATGTARQYRPAMSVRDEYGTLGSIGPTGGGGDVHPASPAIAAEGAFVAGLNFSAAPAAPPIASLTLTGNYNVALAGPDEFLVDPNGANRYMIGPTVAAGNAGKRIKVWNVGSANWVQITDASSTAIGIQIFPGQFQSVIVKPDGTWQVDPAPMLPASLNDYGAIEAGGTTGITNGGTVNLLASSNLFLTGGNVASATMNVPTSVGLKAGQKTSVTFNQNVTSLSWTSADSKTVFGVPSSITISNNNSVVITLTWSPGVNGWIQSGL